jgi:hypothetical protein
MVHAKIKDLECQLPPRVSSGSIGLTFSLIRNYRFEGTHVLIEGATIDRRILLVQPDETHQEQAYTTVLNAFPMSCFGLLRRT